MRSKLNAKVIQPAMRRLQHPQSEPQPPQGALTSFARRVGILRMALAVIVLLFLPMAFFSTTDPVGWQTIPSYVVPGLVVCIAWSLPFDILVSRIFLAGSGATDYRERHRSIVFLDLGMLIALLIFWGPFFVSILKR